LLAQAANALSVLEVAQRDKDASAKDKETVQDWAARNLTAASERLLSPADRIENAVAPRSTYLALPLFAYSAPGVSIFADLSAPHAFAIFAGVLLGLLAGKPLGIGVFSWAALKFGLGRAPRGASLRIFLGATFLCGIGDALAFLLADQAFANPGDASIAKVAVLLASVLAAAIGIGIITLPAGAKTESLNPV
jgi:NhaA family Na+:H+ antiporter